MKIKGFVKPIQNAHAIWVEPVSRFARKKIRHFPYFNRRNGLNPAIGGTNL
jgi:hypothetical protein